MDSKKLPHPTLRRIVTLARDASTDRLAMVRNSTPYREAGLFVLMIGGEAVRDLGPICIEAAGKVVDECAPPSHEGDLMPDDNLDEWFDRMVEKKLYFTWGNQKDPYLMFAFFVGQEIAEYLVPRLNERGCPCRLSNDEDRSK